MSVTTGTERINIKNLAVEAAREEKPIFDVRKAINDQRWGYMCSSLGTEQISKNYDSYLALMANMVFLCPERQMPEIDPELQKSLQHAAEEVPLESLRLIEAEKFCRMFPDYFKDFKYGFDFRAFRRLLDKDFREEDRLYLIYLEAAAAYRILEPEDDLGLDESVWEKWRKHYNNTDFITSALVAADLRVLWPEQFGQLDLSPITDRLDVLKDIAELSRYAQVCRSLAIISASEIQFENHQLKLVNHPRLEEPAQTLPQTRRF